MVNNLNCQVSSDYAVHDSYLNNLVVQTIYDTIQAEGRTIYYMDEYGNGNKHQLFENNIWSPIGLWRTWHQSGEVFTEVIYKEKWDRTKHINQWNKYGKQNLKSGQGILYEINTHVINSTGQDSITYQITDSLKNGSSSIWRSIDDGPYFLYKKSQYVDNIEQPLRIIYHQNGRIKTIFSEIKKDFEGEYNEFHENGTYAEYGVYKNDKKTGHWKSWNELGVLTKLCHYRIGKYRGPYKEFYGTGSLKLSGSYEFTNGIDTIHVYDPETYEEKTIYEETKTYPLKHGKWIYYDHKGQIIKEEIYKKGMLEEN